MRGNRGFIPTEVKIMGKVTGEQILFGILSYLGILVLIPLLVKKDDDFVHFHAKQGLIMLIVWVCVWVITLIPIVGWVVGPILSIVLLILWIIIIIKVVMGEKWVIPVIGKYADKINL